MKAVVRVFLSVLILILLVAFFYYVTGSITRHTGLSVAKVGYEEEFAACLAAQEVRLYLNRAESVQGLHLVKIIEYSSSLEIFNCFFNREFCEEQGIDREGFLIFGKWLTLDASIDEIKEASGC